MFKFLTALFKCNHCEELTEQLKSTQNRLTCVLTDKAALMTQLHNEKIQSEHKIAQLEKQLKDKQKMFYRKTKGVKHYFRNKINKLF